jgi:hypothetical protein
MNIDLSWEYIRLQPGSIPEISRCDERNNNGVVYTTNEMGNFRSYKIIDGVDQDFLQRVQFEMTGPTRFDVGTKICDDVQVIKNMLLEKAAPYENKRKYLLTYDDLQIMYDPLRKEYYGWADFFFAIFIRKRV